MTQQFEPAPEAQVGDSAIGARSPWPLWVRWVLTLASFNVGVVSVLIALMAVNIIADVVGRNLFNSPLPGTLELVSFLWMPGLALLALGYAQIKNEHIRVTVLLESASTSVQRTVAIATEGLAVVLASSLIYLTAQDLSESVARADHPPGAAAWLPLWPGQVMVTLAFVGVLLSAVARIYMLAHGDPPETQGELQRDLREGAAVD